MTSFVSIILTMVFLPRDIEQKSTLRNLRDILPVLLVILLAGGWAAVSHGWVEAAGVRGFATFAFLMLMALLFYMFGRAYGAHAGKSHVSSVYVWPSLIFIAAVLVNFSLEPGLEQLRGLLLGGSILTLPWAITLVGILAALVFGLSFFLKGFGSLLWTEVIMVLLLLVWTFFLLFSSWIGNLDVLNTFSTLIFLFLLLAVAYQKGDSWLASFSMFLFAIFVILEFLE